LLPVVIIRTGGGIIRSDQFAGPVVFQHQGFVGLVACIRLIDVLYPHQFSILVVQEMGGKNTVGITEDGFAEHGPVHGRTAFIAGSNKKKQETGKW
jgi:hypothetical protein